jgi:hypothetical protein
MKNDTMKCLRAGALALLAGVVSTVSAPVFAQFGFFSRGKAPVAQPAAQVPASKAPMAAAPAMPKPGHAQQNFACSVKRRDAQQKYGAVVAPTNRQALDQCLTLLANTHDHDAATAKTLLLTAGRSTDGKKHRSRGRIIAQPEGQRNDSAHGVAGSGIHDQRKKSLKMSSYAAAPGAPQGSAQHETSGAGAVAAGGLLPLLAGKQNDHTDVNGGNAHHLPESMEHPHPSKATAAEPVKTKKGKKGTSDGLSKKQRAQQAKAQALDTTAAQQHSQGGAGGTAAGVAAGTQSANVHQGTASGDSLMQKREVMPKKSRKKAQDLSVKNTKGGSKMTKAEREKARQKLVKALGE